MSSPLVQKYKDTLEIPARTKVAKLIWVPGQRDVEEDERPEEFANNAPRPWRGTRGQTWG